MKKKSIQMILPIAIAVLALSPIGSAQSNPPVQTPTGKFQVTFGNGSTQSSGIVRLFDGDHLRLRPIISQS